MTVMKVLNTGCMFDPPIIGIFIKMKTICRSNLYNAAVITCIMLLDGLNMDNIQPLVTPRILRAIRLGLILLN